MKKPYLISALSMGLVVLGGWLIAANFKLGLSIPALLSSDYMNGLVVAVTGGALLCGQLQNRSQSVLQIVLGGALLVLAILGRFPTLTGLAAVTDLGETAATTLIGATLIGFHVLRSPALPLQISLLIMLCVGLFGLGGHVLDLGMLYRGYVPLDIRPPMAIALLAATLGLWIQSRNRSWYQCFYVGRDDKKISLISGAILLCIASCAGLAGFTLVATMTQEVLANSLLISHEHRARSFQTEIEHAIENAMLVGTRPRFNSLMTIHAQQGMNAAEREELRKILDDIIKNTPISALQLFDTHGTMLGTRGSLITEPDFQAPLATSQDASLLWKRGSYLRARIPIQPKGQRIGLLVMDIPLPAIDRLFHDFAGLGENGLMGVCAANGDGLICMPTRANGYRVSRLSREFEGKPIPMSHAIQGRAGSGQFLDTNGYQVLSAYGPIGKLGLGMVVKVQAAEIYLPVKQRLGYTLAAILILVVIGIFLLRWQITPLARSLVSEIQERKLAEERFAHLAHHDSLTGLPNRVLFHDRLRLAMIDAKRKREMAVVMFLDVDRFKAVNDTLGHEAGDELLKQISLRLQGCLRAGDTVSRLAGDEFALALPAVTHMHDVRQIAERIIESFSRTFAIRSQELFVTASIGITIYPQDASTVEGLLKNADMAMYRAKESGRNNFQFYSAQMHAQMLQRLNMENELRGAIERNEFVLYYQPMVNTDTGQITGMEALLRWSHPQRGLVAPMEFIPLAEESGLIIPIGEWVLRTACAQARAWQQAGLPSLRVSVNLSARQFHKNLADMVEQVLRETGLDASCLELELTESVVMQNAEMAVTTLDALNRMGVQLSIDDFGTGYSSLSYLKRFPINTLKIDRSFVNDIPQDSDDMLITTGIIGLAHSLGIQVVAEGVETQEQRAFLREQHCDAMQGYFFSKPLPAESFARLIRKDRFLGNKDGRPSEPEDPSVQKAG